MADDNRFDEPRNRGGGGYGQPSFGHNRLGPGQFAGSQYGQGFQQGGPSPQQNQGGYGFERFGQPHGQHWAQDQDPGRQGPGPGQGYSQDQYGQAGGYNQGFGGPQQNQQYAGDYGQGRQGGYQPQGGPDAGRSYGRQQGQGSTGFSGQGPDSGQGGYTGQTGTGYGYSRGPQQDGSYHGAHSGGGPEHQSLWDRARSLLTGDDQSPGPHRGRGPKAYSRSDERIRDDVNDRLTDDPFLDASHVEVLVEGGEVTLSGIVSSRSDKRRAEDLADNVSGVKHVQNNLRVESAATMGANPGSVAANSSGESSKPR